MDNFLGEIRLFAGTYAPENWALCNGQLLPVQNNEALFSLIGTTYGGDGRTTFALPDLRGRVPVDQGQGPGLTQRIVGQSGGTETVTITEAMMPAHSHALIASTGTAEAVTPSPTLMLGTITSPNGFYQLSTAPNAQIQTADGTACSQMGGSQAHDNMMPSLCISFIIALVGNFPTRP